MLLMKRETAYGVEPGPPMLGSSGIAQSLPANTFVIGAHGHFDAKPAAARLVESGLPISITVMGPDRVELRAVYVYYRRRLRGGMVRLYVRPVTARA